MSSSLRAKYYHQPWKLTTFSSCSHILGWIHWIFGFYSGLSLTLLSYRLGNLLLLEYLTQKIPTVLLLVEVHNWWKIVRSCGYMRKGVVSNFKVCQVVFPIWFIGANERTDHFFYFPVHYLRISISLWVVCRRGGIFLPSRAKSILIFSTLFHEDGTSIKYIVLW